MRRALGDRSWSFASGFVTAVCLLLAVLAFLRFENLLAGAPGFPLDDTYIHFQLARNLSLGDGMYFNPGEPVAASSAPLWTLTLAALHLLPSDPVIAAKVAGVVLLWTAGLLTWGLARAVGLSPPWALLCSLSVVLTPRLVWGSLSGMEISLYTALATGGVWLHVKGMSHPRPPPWGTFLFAAAALARPECLILFPLALLDRWMASSQKGGGEVIRVYGMHALLYAGLLAPAVFFNLWTSGRPLPGTFYAKVGDYGLAGAVANLDLEQLARTLLYYPLVQAQELFRLGADSNVLLACAAPLGLTALLGRGCASERVTKGARLIPLILILFPLIRGIVAPFKGPLFQHGRYAASMVPLLIIVGAVGLRQALSLIIRGPSTSHWRDSQPAAIMAWGLVFLIYVAGIFEYGREYGSNVADIDRMHVEMARWIAEHTPADAVVASHDVGALGYFSRRRVVDTAGLVTPEVLDHLQPGVPADDGVLEYLREVRPDYLVIMPTWYPRLTRMRRHFEPEHEVRLGDGPSIAAGHRFVAYRATW